MINHTQSYFANRAMQANEKTEQILATLPFFCFDFFISIEQTTSELTRLGYARDLSIFFSFVSSKIFLCQIKELTLQNMANVTSTHVEYFLSYLTQYKLNKKLIKNSEKGKMRKLSAIRKLFEFLFDKNLIPANEVSKVKMPKRHEKDIVRLEINEVSNLLNVAEYGSGLSKKQQLYLAKTSTRDVAILSLFLGTGIRISELVGLNLSDIDFSANAFKITRKGGNQVVLYFSQEVALALTNWLQSRKEIISGDDTLPSLFVSLQKQRISTRAVQNLVKKFAFVASPLKRISPHKLRSTFGTNLYRETKDIYVVADILGHRDVNTTKRHYAAISDEIRRTASDKIKLR